METKTLKIEVPKGYEIDKEKSTFKNIVFKKGGAVVIRWNECHNGVGIKANGEHFILDANPTYYINWYEAMRFYKNKHRSHTCNLPTAKQLQAVHKYFDKINNVIADNCGFVLYKSFYWSIGGESKAFAWSVSMYDGNTYGTIKAGLNYVRAVYTL